MLVVAWPVLLAILLGAVMLASMVPDLLGSINDNPDNTRLVTIVLMAVCAVLALVPLSFILFYSRQGVRRTFETRDPTPTWVDERPLPILAVALALWVGGAGLVVTAVQGKTIPFGYVMTGWPAVAIMTLNGLIWIWLGRQIYWMTRSGWWANLIWGTVAHLSAWIGLRRLGSAMLYPFTEGRSDSQLIPFARTLDGSKGEWLVAASLAIWIGTLVWLRRYYHAGGDPLRSTGCLPC
jgi:hypothetical protein